MSDKKEDKWNEDNAFLVAEVCCRHLTGLKLSEYLSLSTGLPQTNIEALTTVFGGNIPKLTYEDEAYIEFFAPFSGVCYKTHTGINKKSLSIIPNGIYFRGSWTPETLKIVADVYRATGDIEERLVPSETITQIEKANPQDEAFISQYCGDSYVTLVYEDATHIVFLSTDSSIQVLDVINKQKAKICFSDETY